MAAVDWECCLFWRRCACSGQAYKHQGAMSCRAVPPWMRAGRELTHVAPCHVMPCLHGCGLDLSSRMSHHATQHPQEGVLPPGVYTLHDLRVYGRKRKWCPYFVARHMMAFANVVVYNYQYMIDPKVSQVGWRGGDSPVRSAWHVAPVCRSCSCLCRF